ncbi:hypothetical protein K7472_11710 [Streptomyces sp. PTM05]|uniref:NADH:quinone oxidoreductase/Mrp antiporter transmembrane domain-containing protein n=1 Tax=Streptantibioticus parmotrematis TaxID=2873249 RepID=A0ABS7QRE6_9ACTN|nr:proton-conducting transporter membrane subunit [Streptantibioticus parmotrematis]MBY8885513.1 hypothetical protein [Streptantibioticus parmotrematis]
MTTLLLACWGLLAFAAVTDLAAMLPTGRFTGAWHARFSLLCCAVACGGMVVVGAAAMAGHQAGTGSLFAVPGDDGVGTDKLSGLFLVITFGTAAPATWCAADPLRPLGRTRRGLAAVLALLLGAAALILTARGAFGFLFGWELLGFAFYLLAGFDRLRPGRAAASLLTAGFSKASGALLLLGLLLLAVRAHALSLDGLAAAPHGAARTTAYVLLIAGFAVKAGLAPVQVWLPTGYASAPGPARAVMAGAAVNVGFYGLWRTLRLLGAPPHWLAVLLLLTGAASALLGIAHAAVQDRLSRVVAYSSVENAGLIVTGYSVALIGTTMREPRLVAVGLLAATLQVITHALAKTLLFTTAHRLGHAFGTDRLDQLRGTGRALPRSGTGFAIGCLTLAGLPLTCGFTSEWMLLESLMQQFRVGSLGERLAMAAAGALVALTVGFAGVAFVRLVGLTALGSPPRQPLPGAADAGVAASGGIVALALACLGLCAVAPLEVRAVATGIAPIVPASVVRGALGGPWVLGPVFPTFSVLSPSWLWIAMPVLFVAVLAALTGLSRGRSLRVRRVPAWRSATGGVEGDAWYTSHGYANPTRRVLAGVLMTRAQVRTLEGEEAARADAREAGAPVADQMAAGARYEYSSDVVEIVETYLYRPLLRPLRIAVAAARRLQSGRLDAYLTYMLVVLIAVVALVTALA